MQAVEHAHPSRRSFWSQVRSHPWWPHVKRGLTIAFFAIIAWMLVEQTREIQWSQVGHALSRLPRTTLIIAAALAVLGYALYATFDLIGRSYTRHKLSTPRVMMVTFISYAFNMNLGSLVGGIAFRYRLYAKFGLSNDVITRILS